MIPIILSFFLGGIATLSWAGNEKGNGGNVVLCDEGSSKPTIEVLDLYEGRIFRDLPVLPELLKAYEKHELEIIQMALEPLRRLSPRRYQKYLNDLVVFYDHNNFKSNADLLSSEDTYTVALPKGCRLKQVVTQNAKLLPTDPDYTIDLDVWKQMDHVQRAALAIHEIILREAIASGHRDSRLSRLMNSYLWSGKIAAMSEEEFFQFISKDMKFCFTDDGPVWVQLCDNKDPSRTFANAAYSKEKGGVFYVPPGETFTTPFGILYFSSTDEHGEPLRWNLELGPNNQVESAVLSSSEVFINKQKVVVTDNLYLSKEGKFREVNILDYRRDDFDKPEPNCLQAQNSSGSFCLVDHLVWYDNGFIASGTLSSQTTLTLITGERIKVGPTKDKKFEISFWDNGFPGEFVLLEKLVIKKTGQKIPPFSKVTIAKDGKVVSVQPVK